jgi:hypothetical protein
VDRDTSSQSRLGTGGLKGGFQAVLVDGSADCHDARHLVVSGGEGGHGGAAASNAELHPAAARARDAFYTIDLAEVTRGDFLQKRAKMRCVK